MRNINKQENISFDDLKNELIKYMKDDKSINDIYECYKFAEEKHKGQKRKSGDDFIQHPLHTALSIAKWRLGKVSICSALLHDILEDTPITFDELESKFGNEIATIVESITKVSFFAKENRQQIKTLYLRKLYISLAKDIRVIIIKIADRLHNMQTIAFHNKIKQKEISIETLEIYSTIAHRLGMKQAQSQLEDLSFKVLNNKEYKRIKTLLKNSKEKLQKVLINIKEEIKIALYQKTKKNFLILNRTKSIYSIYRKIHFLYKTFDDIHDILAIRIIVDSVDECYIVLGIIHKMFIPLPGKFKDFISIPKNNLYQSLHTTITNSGYIFEIQIRTKEMDQVAKYGAASHWRYKEGEVYNQKQKQEDIENKLDIFSQILEINNKDDGIDSGINFEYEVQQDIFSSLIYLLTPKGKVITLPYGSYILDFSYKIHSEIGHTTIGARINGKFSSINKVLKSGDLVEILTAKNQKPNDQWLDLVKTNSAKDQIRKYLKKEQSNFITKKISDSTKIKEVKEKIKIQILKMNPNFKLYWRNLDIKEKLNKLNYFNLDKLLIDVYDKAFDFDEVVKMVLESNNINDVSKENKIINNISNKTSIDNIKNNHNDIIVKGITNINVALSKCCYPLPNEKIVGLVSKKARIIKVHILNCKNIKNLERDLISVTWNKTLILKKKYLTKVSILCVDQKGMIMKISSILNYYNSSIEQISMKKNKNNNKIVITMWFQVKNIFTFKQIINSINKIPNIYEINRMNF